MNYISELNRFWAWVATHPLSPHAVALWGALMHICNIAGWPKTFTCAASTLEGLTGLSDSTLKRARRELMTAGRIRHLRRPGCQSPIYAMVSISVDKNCEQHGLGKIVGHIGPQSDPQTDPQSGPQSGRNI